MIDDIITLGFLILLQAVLGFDNLLYISLESKRVPEARRGHVRRLGIGIAIAMRIVLLLVVIQVFDTFTKPIFGFDVEGYAKADFDFAFPRPTSAGRQVRARSSGPRWSPGCSISI